MGKLKFKISQKNTYDIFSSKRKRKTYNIHRHLKIIKRNKNMFIVEIHSPFIGKYTLLYKYFFNENRLKLFLGKKYFNQFKNGKNEFYNILVEE